MSINNIPASIQIMYGSFSMSLTQFCNWAAAGSGVAATAKLSNARIKSIAVVLSEFAPPGARRPRLCRRRGAGRWGLCRWGRGQWESRSYAIGWSCYWAGRVERRLLGLLGARHTLAPRALEAEPSGVESGRSDVRGGRLLAVSGGGAAGAERRRAGDEPVAQVGLAAAEPVTAAS